MSDLKDFPGPAQIWLQDREICPGPPAALWNINVLFNPSLFQQDHCLLPVALAQVPSGASLILLTDISITRFSLEKELTLSSFSCPIFLLIFLVSH